MTDDEIGKIVSSLLRKRYRDVGFRSAEVESDRDFDGNPIIRVTATFKNDAVPPSRLADALSDIRSELLSKGEDRFVFLDRAHPQEVFADEDSE